MSLACPLDLGRLIFTGDEDHPLDRSTTVETAKVVIAEHDDVEAATDVPVFRSLGTAYSRAPRSTPRSPRSARRRAAPPRTASSRGWARASHALTIALPSASPPKRRSRMAAARGVSSRKRE